MEQTITVSEWMAEFIKWAGEKGEEDLRKIIRDHLMELKAEWETSKKSRINGGFMWNPLLEPNDGAEQWKKGGDCTLCRKAGYCMSKCKPNKLLKKITTPFLYQQYLTEVPEAAAKRVAGMDPKKLMQQLGVLQ